MHPFVKWAGGKTQLLDNLIECLPNKYNHYYEPFVGGGALLFKLKPTEFTINDYNLELIQTYKCFKLQSDYKKLIDNLNIHQKNNFENYYYKIREMDKLEDFNKLPIYERAARLIYLNKACFNGLYRVNSKGFFNVPFGKKEKVICYDETNFDEIFSYISNSKNEIYNGDFETCLKNVKEGDFVYFDPPYDTLENKNSFTSYAKTPFGKNEQIRLSNIYKELSNKGIYLMLSNHNTNFIRDLYKDFYIHVVNAKRMINSDAKNRGYVEEVIITNYMKIS